MAKIRGLAVIPELVYLLILCCISGEFVKMSSVADASTPLDDGQAIHSELWGDQVDAAEADGSETSDELSDDNALLVEIAEEIVEEIVEENVEENVEEFELPEALKQLMSVGGVRFAVVPEGTWNVNGYSAKLRRFYSVTFAVDDEISSSNIVEAIANAGVDAEHIYSIQFRNSNRSWCVTFTDQLSKETILEKGVIHLGGVPVFIGDADFRVVIVKIYEAPPEMPDTVLIGRLSHYGRVLSFRRDRGLATGILNGVRTARMRLAREIPSAIRIAGEPVYISYPGQPKTCRKCGDTDHLAQGCKNPRCYNCEAPGHRSADCPKDPLCGICMKPDHPVAECPYRIFSANIVSGEQTATYAEAAKQNQPAAASPASGTSGSQSNSQPSTSTSQEKSSSKSSSKSSGKDDRGKDNQEKRDKRDGKSDNQGEKRAEKSDRRSDNRDPEARNPDSRDPDSRDPDGRKSHSRDPDSDDPDRRNHRKGRREKDDRDGRDDHHSRRGRDWSHSRERSSREYDRHYDRRRDRDYDRRRRRDYSPELYTDESDYDDRDRDRRKRHRR